MGEPRPILLLVALQGIAVVALAGWWVLQSPGERLTMLTRIAQTEEVRGSVPLEVQAQAQWLLRHRLTRLQGMTGLGLLMGILGSAEGVARRRKAVYGGFLYKAWVIGTLCLPVALGVGLSYLVLPWPLSQFWYGIGLSSVVGLIGFSLVSGRPFIA